VARGPWPLTANIMSSNRPNLPVPPASPDDWSDLVHPGTAGDANSNGSGSGIDDWENLLTEQPAPQAPPVPAAVTSGASARASGSLQCQPGASDSDRAAWASQAASVLGHLFKAHPWQGVSLRYASDCSGCESAWYALQDLMRALRDLGTCGLRAPVHEYASEHPGADGDAARRWLRHHSSALRMYRDMHKRIGGGTGAGAGGASAQGAQCDWAHYSVLPTEDATGTAHDWRPQSDKQGFVDWPGVPVPLPGPGTLDFYVGGFVCTDNSRANRFRKKGTMTGFGSHRKPHTGAGSRDPTGQSFMTYSASKAAIRREKPRRFILENVGLCPVDATVKELRRDLPAYYVVGVKTDAIHFGGTVRRFRVFVIGVQKVLTTVPLSQWAELLCSVGAACGQGVASASAPDAGFGDCWLLPDGDPYPREVFTSTRVGTPQP